MKEASRFEMFQDQHWSVVIDTSAQLSIDAFLVYRSSTVVAQQGTQVHFLAVCQLCRHCFLSIARFARCCFVCRSGNLLLPPPTQTAWCQAPNCVFLLKTKSQQRRASKRLLSLLALNATRIQERLVWSVPIVPALCRCTIEFMIVGA